jgi:hypothetical protein
VALGDNWAVKGPFLTEATWDPLAGILMPFLEVIDSVGSPLRGEEKARYCAIILQAAPRRPSGL